MDTQLQSLFRLYSFEPEQFNDFVENHPGIFITEPAAKSILQMIFTSICFFIEHVKPENFPSITNFDDEVKKFQHILNANPQLLFEANAILDGSLIEFIIYYTTKNSDKNMYNSFLQNIIISWIEFKDLREIKDNFETILNIRDDNQAKKLLHFIHSNPSEFELLMKEKLISQNSINLSIAYLNKSSNKNKIVLLGKLEKHLLNQNVSMAENSIKTGAHKI